MSEQKIPTRMTGPKTKEVINKKKVIVYHTDVGPLTAKEIGEIFGIKRNRIFDRYKNMGWNHPGIFSPVRIKKGRPKGPDLPPELLAIDTKKLGKRQRTAKLQEMKTGTWEEQNL